ncbi:MAG TPA: heparan-alpha-glucosaminide N-acetyltransferase domain-containing protein [Pyrinomonadaceae bacterium]|nr:heparan-alpha-glucosaminide N-acetyltransferase domain-containing protein [Pyrinomonadaceae bacterium]
MTEQTTTLRDRIYSIDLLRGIVMMIMLLDHTREFVHAGALTSDPTDPATTTAAVFFTRWITHFCAPIFVFLSGVSIYLQKANGKTNGELSWFLVTRGLWLVFLEFTLIRFLIVFNLDYTFFGMAQVIWVIGISMIVMAALIYLPVRIIGIAGVLMIVLHNLLDRFSLPPNIAFAATPPPDALQTLWIILHQQAILPLFGGASTALLAYPLIPWVGVMAAGYALGTLYSLERDTRQKWLLRLGMAATALFVILRAINVYGDPVPWKYQDTSVATVLSFFNVSKYPPSLAFLLMTIGPGMIVLALTDRIDAKSLWQRICVTFGRVPMFYYILQWLTAHSMGVILSALAGKQIGYLFVGILAMGQAAPPNYGFSLAITYAAWISGLIILYPLCKWWSGVKSRNKHWALGYL